MGLAGLHRLRGEGRTSRAQPLRPGDVERMEREKAERRPGGVILVARRLSGTEVRRLRTVWDQLHGHGGAHGVTVLPDGAEWRALPVPAACLYCTTVPAPGERRCTSCGAPLP